MNTESLVKLFNELLEKGYHASLDISWFQPDGNIRIHDCSKPLTQVKKDLSVNEITKSTFYDKSGMYASAENEGT
jgi:hypothetical protein